MARRAVRLRRRGLAVLALCAFGGACAGPPISVHRVSPERVQRKLTRSVLSTGRLSEASRDVLRRANLLEVFRADPESALEAGLGLLRHRSDRSQLRGLEARGLVALAEAAFLHASRSGDRAYFWVSAVYAWAFLFGGEHELEPLDPAVRLATNLYNRGLTLATQPEDLEQGLALEGGIVDLPIGQLEVTVDDAVLRWGDRVLTRFTPVADLDIRGLKNRYRFPGLGAPVAASTTLPEGVDETSESALVHDRVRVPVSLVLVIDDVMAGLDSGRLRGHVEVRSFLGETETVIAGRPHPAEFEPSASLALMMTEVAPWQNELRALFQGDLEREQDGLVTLSLHRPGRIPVILVHGTASSTATWANMVNDLVSDRVVLDRYEFWLFTYNTGAPILYSASLLRSAIADMVRTLDPEGKDPALRRAVVVGHSQGGLVTKLQAVDSGPVFWNQISDVPLESLKMGDETRSLIERAIFFEPSPYVERVVFIATPHRGSFLLTYGITNFVRNLVRVPTTVVRAAGDLVTQNPEAAALRRIDDTEGALHQMNPSSEFLANLRAMPVAPGISAHSIIPVRSLVDKEEQSDGVVEYRSAHLEDVDSEVLVESGHSCLAHPLVVQEVRRILLMHALSRPRDGRAAAVATDRAD